MKRLLHRPDRKRFNSVEIQRVLNYNRSRNFVVPTVPADRTCNASAATVFVVFGRYLDRPWLSPSDTADGHWFTTAKLPICLGQLLLKVVHGGK